MTKIYRGRNISVKFLICCILSFQAISVSPLKSLTAGHRKIIYMAINRLTKMFPPRQNVVEQPRAHLVANSSETAHPHGVRRPCPRTCRSTGRCFNPRTHTGCDDREDMLTAWIPKFQSTHPHGVRRCRHCGTDSAARVSIHAPTRGATLSFFL